MRASFGRLHSWSALGLNRSHRDSNSIAVSVRHGHERGGPPLYFHFRSQIITFTAGPRLDSTAFIATPTASLSRCGMVMNGPPARYISLSVPMLSLPVQGSRHIGADQLSLLTVAIASRWAGQIQYRPGARLG